MRTSLLTLVLGSLIAGCGTTPPPAAAEAIGTTTPKPLPKAEPAPIPDSPSSSIVAIDPAIQTACKLPAKETFFAFDSSILQPKGQKLLDAVVECFVKGALKGRSLRLVGRADPRGESEYNLVLGQSRADSVAHYLVTNGLDSAQQSTTTRGAMDSTGFDELTWAKDRRVDLLLNP